MTVLVTLVAALIAIIGAFFQLAWIFWIGVFLCLVLLYLDMASGVMRLPVLPVIFAVVGAWVASSWFMGMAYGVVAWTAFEGLSMLLAVGRTGSARGKQFATKANRDRNVLEAHLRETAMKIAPGGYDQVDRGGREIVKITNGKISLDDARKLYGAIGYLMESATDRSPERIQDSIQMRGKNQFSRQDAAAIYRFLLLERGPRVPSPIDERDQTVEISRGLTSVEVMFVNKTRHLTVVAANFALLLLHARREGWQGCPSFFIDADDSMRISHHIWQKHNPPLEVTDDEAISFGTKIQIEMVRHGIDRETEEGGVVANLVNFCLEGGFFIEPII